MNIARKSTRGPLGLLLGLWLCCSAAQAQLTAIVAVEPTARKAAHSILRTSAESGLSKAAGQPVALTTSDDLADVMRATRSAGYDIFIGPARWLRPRCNAATSWWAPRTNRTDTCWSGCSRSLRCLP